MTPSEEEAVKAEAMFSLDLDFMRLSSFKALGGVRPAEEEGFGAGMETDVMWWPLPIVGDWNCKRDDLIDRDLTNTEGGQKSRHIR